MAGCRGLQDKWVRRADAVERLESVVEDVQQYTVNHPLAVLHAAASPASKRGSDHGVGLSSGGQQAAGDAPAPVAVMDGGVQHSRSSVACSSSSTASSASGTMPGTSNDLVEWDQKIKFLESAINEAKESNISVNKVGAAGGEKGSGRVLEGGLREVARLFGSAFLLRYLLSVSASAAHPLRMPNHLPHCCQNASILAASSTPLASEPSVCAPLPHKLVGAFACIYLTISIRVYVCVRIGEAAAEGDAGPDGRRRGGTRPGGHSQPQARRRGCDQGGPG